MLRRVKKVEVFEESASVSDIRIIPVVQDTPRFRAAKLVFQKRGEARREWSRGKQVWSTRDVADVCVKLRWYVSTA